jgi:diacylglycerol kinase
MAFRTEVIVIAFMTPIGIWIGETAVQWTLLIGSSMLTAVFVWALIAYERFLH